MNSVALSNLHSVGSTSPFVMDSNTVNSVNQAWTTNGNLNYNGHFINCPCQLCTQLNIVGHQLGCSCPTCAGTLPPNFNTFPWHPQQPYWVPLPLSSPNTILATPPPLTDEEKQELEELRRIRKEAIKQAKLDAFKKLPSQLRQYVVDSIMWEKGLETINGIYTVELSDRERELELKAGPSPNHAYDYFNKLAGFQSGQRTVELPDGLTAEDLMQAHNDACLEETIDE